MSRHTDPFYSAKLLARLARPDAEDFNTACQAFANKCKLQMIEDYDQHLNQTIVRFRVISDIPDRLERDATRLVNELRSALDKSVNAASKIIKGVGSGKLKYTHFPFGSNMNELERQLSAERGLLRDIPKELHEHLLSLKPYIGGNDTLAAVGKLSNPAKHENLLALHLRLPSIGINGGDWHFAQIRPIWNEAKDECELFRLKGIQQSYHGLRIRSTVTFNDAESLAGKEVAPTLFELARMVEEIVLGLEAKTASIIQGRKA